MRLVLTLQALLAASLAGMGVALYLSYSYLLQTRIACPDGGCSTVQESAYAWIGPVPVPALGAAVYLLIVIVTVLALLSSRHRELLLSAVFGVTLAGVLFSVYLTYVELYIIHAVCTWCVVSAILMAIAFGLSLLALRQFHAQSP